MSTTDSHVPDRLAERITDVHREAGTAWLSRLPDIIVECERRWSLKVFPPFDGLSYNYVAPAVRADGTDVVMKLGVPHDGLTAEIEALRHFDGRGAAKLLEVDPDLGAMVLERLKPGALLSTVTDDAQATSIAAQVMKRLWRPALAEHPFPTIAMWAEGLKTLRAHFDGGTGPMPAALVERAEAMIAELIGTMGETVLLHGDLHHYNILSAEREPWLAIDPKGVVGEAECEVFAFLHNNLLDQPEPQAVLRRRIDQLAEELAFDRKRIADWGMAQAVLATWWYYEDHGHVAEQLIACSELFEGL